MAGIIAGQVCGVAKAVDIVPIKLSEAKTFSYSALLAGISTAITASASKGGVINISMRLGPSKAMKRVVAKVRSGLLLLCSSVPPVRCSLTPDVNAGFGV
jgi:hypothetical protein